MIFLLESNRHASIACNNSTFYSMVQNSRNVKHICYINYLCIRFCWVLGYSHLSVLVSPPPPPFLFSSHLEFQCMNSFSPLKILLGYYFLWIEYLILGRDILAVQESVNGHLWNLTANQPYCCRCLCTWHAHSCAHREIYWLTEERHIFILGENSSQSCCTKTFSFIILRKQGMYDHTKVKVVIKIITSNENVYCTVGFVTGEFPVVSLAGCIQCYPVGASSDITEGWGFVLLSKEWETLTFYGVGQGARDCLVLCFLEIRNAFIWLRLYILNLGQPSLFPSSWQK